MGTERTIDHSIQEAPANGPVEHKDRPRARKPYVTPVLRHLGSVRDLTLGTSNKIGEAGTHRNM